MECRDHDYCRAGPPSPGYEKVSAACNYVMICVHLCVFKLISTHELHSNVFKLCLILQSHNTQGSNEQEVTRTETLLCSDLSVGLGVEASSLVIDFNYPDLKISLPQRSIQQSNAALHDSSPFSIIEVICFALFFCIRSLGVLYFMAKFSVH